MERTGRWREASSPLLHPYDAHCRPYLSSERHSRSRMRSDAKKRRLHGARARAYRERRGREDEGVRKTIHGSSRDGLSSSNDDPSPLRSLRHRSPWKSQKYGGRNRVPQWLRKKGHSFSIYLSRDAASVPDPRDPPSEASARQALPARGDRSDDTRIHQRERHAQHSPSSLAGTWLFAPHGLTRSNASTTPICEDVTLRRGTRERREARGERQEARDESVRGARRTTRGPTSLLHPGDPLAATVADTRNEGRIDGRENGAIER